MESHAGVEVLTMGRIGVDLYPLQIGVSLREVADLRQVPRRQRRPTWRSPRPGYGRRSAVITRTGARPVRRVPPRRAARLRRRRPVRHAGAGPADPGDVLRDLPAGRLPAVLLPPPEGAGPGDPRRRAGPGRDPRRGRLLGHRHRPVPGAEPGGHARRAARPAAGAGITVFDLDYRPMFWPSREEARPLVRARRCRTPPSRSATSTSATPRSASASRDAAADGAARRRASSSRSSSRARTGVLGLATATTEVEVPPVPVEVVNGLGAGDAFGGALCHGLLAGWDLERDDALLQRRRRDRRRPAGLRRRHAHRPPRSRPMLRGGRPCMMTGCASSSTRGSTARTRSPRRAAAAPPARRRCSATTAG